MIIYIYVFQKTTFVNNLQNKSLNQSIDMVPLLFGKHELPIECVAIQSNIIVSASLSGQVSIWDANLSIFL